MCFFIKDNIAVRKICDDFNDKSLLLQWLSNSKLLELAYGEDAPWDMKKIEDTFTKNITTSQNNCIIEYEDKEVGYIQFYPLTADSYRFNADVPYTKFIGGYGIDLFIGYPELWGKGIGTNVVKLMTEYLLNVVGSTVVCADPEEDNQRSIKCWIKAGFTPMGKVENYDEPNKNSIIYCRQ